MAEQQPDQSTNPVINFATGQHFLAEIKYPNIPDIISIDKIFNVLQKIKTTSKPLFYKWQQIYRPQNGEIFLEQKYPLTRDPVTGEQFPIVDDGYNWSSIPKPEIREYQGQQIEVFKWLEGYTPGDQFFTISKTEYRLKFQNNVLFLIHYLKIKDPSVPVKTAIPPTKVSPLYLQQQFFQYVKQQVAQMNTIRRSPSPNFMANQRPPVINRPNLQAQNNKPTAAVAVQKIVPTAAATAAAMAAARHPQQVDSPESSIDPFDLFDDYEAAFYRLNVLKPLLTRLFESPTPVKKAKSSGILEGIEADLIAATKRKISSLQERTESFRKSHQETVQQIKKDRQIFWSIFGELDCEEVDLDQVYKKLIENEMRDMEQDDILPVYTSL